MNNDQIKKRIIAAVQRILDDALPSNQEGDRTDEAAADQWNLDADTQRAYDELKTELSGLWQTDRRVG
ncbi:hypothetical protein IFO70_32830 [Phormidium tenue FACHB-886]|nr:hypothetical protein [Phormidium tenue FACHB-886]